ncbi:MAG: tetratricopeptide repeat protein, partial [Anaerolineae bacterium]
MIEATHYPDVTDPIELTALARALRRAAPGALLVARVNAPALREEIRRWLMENGGRPLRPVELTDDRSILSQLKEADGEAAGDAALSVFGLEHLPDSSLARFNRERAGLRALKHPVLLWVSEHGLRRLLEHAPDVFDWHSGFYEFVPTREMQLLEALQALAEWDTPMWIRGPEERRRRIRELEAILQDYREAGDRVDLTGDLLRALGTLYWEEGEIGRAEEALREALAIFQSVGDRAGIAQTLHQLGMLAQQQGDTAEARRLYGEALEIRRQLGDRAGIA